MKLEEELQQKSFKNEYHKLALNIMFSFHWLSGRSQSLFKDKEITAQQYNVLRILRGQYPKPSSIKLIRERLLDRMSDASRMIDKLVEKKLVERSVCLTDKRSTNVLITAKGLAILESLDFIDDTIMGHLKALDEKEALLLNTLLDKMRD